MGSAAETKAPARCARCGACTVVCPVYRASGGREPYSGRGKKHLLDLRGTDVPSPVFEDIFSKCLLCGACVSACPRDIDIPGEVRRARATFSTFYGEHGYRKFLARKVLEHPELLGVVRTFGRSFKDLLERGLPRDSGLRLQLALFDKGDSGQDVQLPRESGSEDGLTPLLYFPGCSAKHLYPEIIAACRTLFHHAGHRLTIPDGLVCCGLAIDAAGDVATSRLLAKKNIALLERGQGQIMVSCGSCLSHLQRYGKLFDDEPQWRKRGEAVAARTVEMSQVLDTVLPDKMLPKSDDSRTQKIFYQDPCHLRHGRTIIREPRRVLSRFPSVELLELPDGPQCCGHGGLFHLGAPGLSARIRDDLAQRVLAMEPDVITSSCSGCLMQWRMAVAAAGKTLPVLHLAELLVKLLP